MTRYDKYKDCDIEWIGKIPEEWEEVPLKSLFNERKEKNTKMEIVEILSLVKDVGIIKYDEKGNVGNKSKNDISGYNIVYENDLVLNKMNAVIGSLGVSSYKGLVSPIYLVLSKKNGKKLSMKYIEYSFKNKVFQKLFRKYSKGIMEIRESIDYVEFKNSYIPFPPFETQNKIAKYLDNKNGQSKVFISNQEKIIKLLKEQKKAIINKAVTKGINTNVKMKDSGVEWLGEIPEHWEIKKLRFLGTFQNGISQSGDYFGAGFPFLSYGDVYNNSKLPEFLENQANSSEQDRKLYSVCKGDVFFTRTSETIEEIAFSSTCCKTINDAVFSGFLIRFRPKKNVLFDEFSQYYFISEIHRKYFIREMNIVIRASLSQGVLKDLPVLLPPLNEQMEIYEYINEKVNKIDIAISKAEQEVKLAKEYMESLIFNVVTGQIKVD